MKPECVTELLQSHDEAWMEKSFFFRMSKESGVSWNRIYWWKYFIDCWNDPKGFKVLDKLSWWSSDRVWEDSLPILKEVQLMGEMLSDSVAFYREIACEKKGHLMQRTSLLSYFKKLPHISRKLSFKKVPMWSPPIWGADCIFLFCRPQGK